MLRHTIQTDLRKLKEHGIKPIFVFDGLSLPPQQKPLETPDQNPVFRNEAWELYDKSMANQAVDAFRKSGGFANAYNFCPTHTYSLQIRFQLEISSAS